MDLDECYKKNLIKKARWDSGFIKSLIEMSDTHENTVNTAEINNKNISSYVSLAYDSLREILEAICISKGFKVLNHVCLGELLKTLIDNFDFFEFDRMRYIRNGISYYGTKIELDQGRVIIKKMFVMKKNLADNYLKEYKKNNDG